MTSVRSIGHLASRRTVVQSFNRGVAPPARRGVHTNAGSSPRSSYSNRQNYQYTLSGRTAGTALAVGTGLAAVYWLDREGWQLQLLQTARADEPVTPHIELDQTPVHLDPDTKMPFPSTLRPACTDATLELVGLGARTVSFLRVQVYSVGSYFAPEALQSLKGSEAPLATQGEALISSLLDRPYDTAIRIVPVKNTDHGHLRDGFVRAMLARLKLASSSGAISEEQAEAAGMAIETFKGFFPTGKVPRGKSLLLVRRGSDGALLLEYEGRLLGTLQDKFLAKQLMLAYFADNGKEISPKMKTDVMTGLNRFL